MTEKELGTLMAIIPGIWSMFKHDTATIKLWHKFLGSIDFKDAESAIYKLAMEKDFPPVPADILKLCGGNQKQNAKVSFNKVYRLIGKYGFNGYERAKIEMSESEIETVKRVGWRNMCCFDIEHKALSQLENQFVNAFEQIQPKERAPELNISETLKLKVGDA